MNNSKNKLAKNKLSKRNLNTRGSGRIMQICEFYDPNPTQSIVKIFFKGKKIINFLKFIYNKFKVVL